MSINLLQNNPAALYRASDLNYDLWCFWSCLRDRPQELIDGIQQVYDRYRNGNGKELFSELVATRHQQLTDMQRGIDFYVLNRITFSGVVDSGGYSAAAFAGRFTQSGIDRLSGLVALLRKVYLTHADYSQLLQLAGNDVVLFLDPPYYTATKSKLYGKKGDLHTGFDHTALRCALENCPHKWIITYDNSDHIRDLYKEYYQLPWQLQYGMTNKPVSFSNEIIIANYNLQQAKDLNLTFLAENRLRPAV